MTKKEDNQLPRRFRKHNVLNINVLRAIAPHGRTANVAIMIKIAEREGERMICCNCKKEIDKNYAADTNGCYCEYCAKQLESLRRKQVGIQMVHKMIEIVKPFVSGSACEEESGSCELTDCRSCNAINVAQELYKAGYRKQSEVAKEIFDEIKIDARNAIERINQSGLNPAIKKAEIECYTDILEYAEMLKKKYTEESGNDR